MGEQVAQGNLGGGLRVRWRVCVGGGVDDGEGGELREEGGDGGVEGCLGAVDALQGGDGGDELGAGGDFEGGIWVEGGSGWGEGLAAEGFDGGFSWMVVRVKASRLKDGRILCLPVLLTVPNVIACTLLPGFVASVKSASTL